MCLIKKGRKAASAAGASGYDSSGRELHTASLKSQVQCDKK